MKKIVILGSTGSIGENALNVARNHADKVRIFGLSTKQNIDLLARQVDEFSPQIVSVWNEEKATELKKRIGSIAEVHCGMEGLISLARADADLVVSALVGSVGLDPAFEAVKSGTNLALANKEVLVMAGDLLMAEAMRNRVKIIPVDSEHSAIMQCLWERRVKEVKRLILTASGGPFYNKGDIDLSKITPKMALEHPTWKMGHKVTIDSSTLMNKGFEVIEASCLFGIPIDRIDVVIHPESIIHALVEFIDGSVIALMHAPNMCIPIQYAISWPDRWEGRYGEVSLADIGKMHFFKPDNKRFPALDLAYHAGSMGGTMPAVLSAADEVCVEKFINGKILYSDIVRIIKNVMDTHRPITDPTLADILSADKWAREMAEEVIKG